MQDQKQHVMISICSLIVGNQISERIGAKTDKAPDSTEAAAAMAESTEAVQADAEAEEEVAVATTDASKRSGPGLPQIIGKAVGTLLLALIVWRIFGRRRQKKD